MKNTKGCLTGCLIVLVCLIALIVAGRKTIGTTALNIITNIFINADYYTMGNDKIPSIKKVVGPRGTFEMNHPFSKDKDDMRLVYGDVENPADDLTKYVFYLRDKKGYKFTKPFDSSRVPGSTQLTKKSADKGKFITLDIKYDDKTYTLVFTKNEGNYANLSAESEMEEVGDVKNPYQTNNAGASPAKDRK